MLCSELAHFLGMPLVGSDSTISGFSIDTRTLQPGNVFVAIKGVAVDGAQFIPDAIAKGAAAIISHTMVHTSLPCWQVADPVQTLQDFAAHWRAQFNIPVIAITGSCGKTSTKTWLARVLGVYGTVLATPGNYNNELGLPLSLLQLRPEHQYAVLEMGAARSGDIQHLTALAKPTIGMITTIGAAHLADFGSLETIAATKGEIYATLGQNGVGIVPIDVALGFVTLWKSFLGERQQITFGLKSEALITAREVVYGDQDTRGILVTPQGDYPFVFSVPGQHALQNILGVFAVIHALGLDIVKSIPLLAELQNFAGRGQQYPLENGGILIDDSYNANPLSVHAAIDTLSRYTGETILVLGDMLALGEASERLHMEVGQYAKTQKIQQLWGFGTLTPYAVEAFGAGGQHFTDKTTLVKQLKHELHSKKVIVLIKGSRMMRMEEIKIALLGALAQEQH